MKEKKEAWKKYVKSNNEQDRINYTTLRDRTIKQVTEANRKSWEELGKEPNQTYGTNNRYFWDKVKTMRGQKRKEIKGIIDR